MFIELPLLIFLVLIALATGFVKTGLPVLGALISVLMVLAFPPKDALALTLIYLMMGDVFAVRLYWHQANKRELLRMLPAIIVGIIVGIILIRFISDALLGLLIGITIIALTALEPFRERVTAWAMARLTIIRGVSGVLAGFSTTVGNVAGPILALYFLLLKLNKYTFAGTAALFFLIVNLIKLPLYASIGLFKFAYFPSILLTVPLVFLGAFIGRSFLSRIPQKAFNQVTLIFTFLGGLLLVMRSIL